MPLIIPSFISHSCLYLQSLFAGFPDGETDLATYKRNLQQSRGLRWEENWEHTVYPLFKNQ